jgi:hypothetical protein
MSIPGSETFEINFTSCDYNFKSLNGSKSVAQVHILCGTVGDAIDLSFKGTICLQIAPFTSTGIGYHDSGIGEAKDRDSGPRTSQFQPQRWISKMSAA